MSNTGISAKRITALLCALVFVLSMALTGCQIGSSDEGKTTTTKPTGNQALEYVDPNQGLVCPKCGSSNVDDAWREGENYDGRCYICHSGCLKDAKEVARVIKRHFSNIKGEVIINNIGTAIGAHSGPGTIGLFFWGNERE